MIRIRSWSSSHEQSTITAFRSYRPNFDRCLQSVVFRLAPGWFDVKYLIPIVTLIVFAARSCQTFADEGPVLLPPKTQNGSADSQPKIVPSRKRRATDSSPVSPQPTMSPEEMQGLIRSLVIELIPSQYDDTKKWGQTKEVVSGLNVRLDGLRLKTKRRRKMVNHGTWKRYTVELVNPKQEFDFKIDSLKTKGAGTVTFRASVVTPLKVTARVQEWSYGARLLSVSTDAESRVRLQADCEIVFEMDGKKFPPDVIIRPKINAADIQLIDFEVKRISHVKGTLAKEMGRSTRSLVERRIEKKRQQLPEKINRKIAAKQDRLRLSPSDLLNSKWGKLMNPFGDRPNSDSEPRGSSSVESATDQQ